ncbi:hypothetical protein KAR91_70290, partial [Candidatus Pacearchaeota archaeon]|nr:hypothetical protein [Candidatus Pacearchaeota archaeon]
MAASKTIEILIKLKQAGLEAVKETVKQLENLKKAAAGVEVEQINKVNESIESIGETTSKIAKDIRETIGSIAGQAQDIASSASGRIRENIEKTVEKLFTRIAVFTALLAVTGKSLLTLGVQFKFLGDSVALAFGVFSSFPELAVSFIKTPIIEIISTVTILSTNLFDFIFSNVLKLGSFFSGISSIFVRMFTSVGAVFGPFGVLAAGVTNLFIIKTLLGETRLLIRRIRGVGLESLTPIERATRLLTVVDQSINQIGVNAGQIIKVLGFGITTFFAPLLGGIPLINSLITLTQNAGRRLRLSFFAFFGSARAQFLRIFLDLKKFGFDAAASFVTMRGEAEKADKALRRGGSIFVSNKTLKENASVFEGLSKLKLPFAKQFQIAIFEVNKLLSVIFVQVRNLTVTIQQALGLSSKAVKAIDKDSRGVFSNLNKEIKNTQEKFTLIPGTFTRLFRKSVQSIRGFFNRDLLSFFRRRPTAQAPGAEKQTQQAQQIKIQQKLQEQFLKTAESLTVVLGAEKQATAALVQLGEAAKITASQVMPALQASITGVNTQIVELKKAAGAEGLTAAMINVNKITKKVGGEALPNLQKAAGNTAESTKKAVKEVFNLSDSTGKLNRSISGSINTFGSYIGSLFKVEKSQSTAKAATENLRTVVEELVLKFGKSSQALVPFAKRFSEALSGKGFKVDPKKLEESFKPLKKTLDKLV